MDVSLIVTNINNLINEFNTKTKSPDTFNISEFCDKCSKIIPSIDLNKEYTHDELSNIIEALKSFSAMLVNLIAFREFKALYDASKNETNELSNKKEEKSEKQLFSENTLIKQLKFPDQTAA